MPDSHTRVSGAQEGHENFERFLEWKAKRDAANDWHLFIHPKGRFAGRLNRNRVSESCGIGERSTGQNPRISSMLDQIETMLAARGTPFAPAVPASTVVLKPRRDEAVEASGGVVASAGSHEESVAVEQMKAKLARNHVLVSHLAACGRLLRW